jgi:two-component system, response regulator PdtaR
MSFLNAARLNPLQKEEFHVWGHRQEMDVAEIEASVAGKRFLVLDDEFLIALDIQQMLETAGAADVLCVAHADGALKELRNGSAFDCAVLDVKLGDRQQNSLTVATLLTQRGTPFIFLTGMRGEYLHTKEFPNVPIVEKPYDAAALMDALRRAMMGK